MLYRLSILKYTVYINLPIYIYNFLVSCYIIESKHSLFLIKGTSKRITCGSHEHVHSDESAIIRSDDGSCSYDDTRSDIHTGGFVQLSLLPIHGIRRHILFHMALGQVLGAQRSASFYDSNRGCRRLSCLLYPHQVLSCLV